MRNTFSDQDILIELIRVAVGVSDSLSRQPSSKEWVKLFEMVKKQSLVGVCFVGLQRLGADADEGFARIGMSEMLYLTWMGMAAKIQQKNEIVNQQCAKLQMRLSADGLRSCILKGQGIASLYKCGGINSSINSVSSDLSRLRQSGDIDVWIDASKEKIVNYVMMSAPTIVFDWKHIHFNCFEDTEVEAHWIPVKRHNPLWNRVLENYFDRERNRQFSNILNGLCMPTVDFQLVHQLLHVYSHYVYEGVGLRQIMDLYFAQLACTNCAEISIEHEKFLEVLELFKKLGLQKFVAATQWVLQEVFGLQENALLCTSDEKEGRKLLDEIMIGGNFGHYDERNNVEGESFLGRFLRRWKRKFRMFRFDPLGTLIMPFSRLQLEFWMRKTRREYGV